MVVFENYYMKPQNCAGKRQILFVFIHKGADTK